MSGRFEGPATIFGGLPVIALVVAGKDEDTPNGPGDYWTEVEELYWRKRDGTKGKALPTHLCERAIDKEGCDIADQVFDHIAHQDWLAKQEQGE